MTTQNDDLYSPEPESTETKPLNIRVPASLKDAFDKLCESKGTNPSRVLRNFIARELERTKQ